jgi:hypothetical protein
MNNKLRHLFIESNIKKELDDTYTYTGNLDLRNLNLVSLEELPVNITKLYGDLICSCNKLKNLKGCPEFISGTLDCSYNFLESLEGAPLYIGKDFNCNYNKLTDLKYFPQNINRNISISNNKINSLQFCPEVVHGNFDCSYNVLESLEGAPSMITKEKDEINENHFNNLGNFNCRCNKLKSLKGAPEIISGYFRCDNNYLETLINGPKIIGYYFDCSNNRLLNLKGAPKFLISTKDHWNGLFNCSFNKLNSLEGAPQYIEGGFNCRYNKLISLKGAPMYVFGSFDCSNTEIIDLEGAPVYAQSIDCSSVRTLVTLYGYHGQNKNFRITSQKNKLISYLINPTIGRYKSSEVFNTSPIAEVTTNKKYFNYLVSLATNRTKLKEHFEWLRNDYDSYIKIIELLDNQNELDNNGLYLKNLITEFNLKTE